MRNSLFASAAMKKAGPLEAGLLTAHPEHRRDADHQHHQVLHDEQNQVRPARLVHLHTHIMQLNTKYCLE